MQRLTGLLEHFADRIGGCLNPAQVAAVFAAVMAGFALGYHFLISPHWINTLFWIAIWTVCAFVGWRLGVVRGRRDE